MKPLRLILLLGVLAIMSLPVTGSQAQESSVKEFVITDSLRDVETQIATFLQEQFKLSTSFQVINNNPDDLAVAVRIAETPQQSVPELSVRIDTRVISRQNSDQAPAVQVISIASAANVQIKENKELEALRMLNAVNAQTVPAHAYLAGRQIVVSNNQLLTPDAALSADRFGIVFINVLRTWPALLKALRQQELLDE